MLARDPQRVYKPIDEQQPTRKKVVKKKKKNTVISKSAAMFMAFTFLGICLFLLSKYAGITAIRTEITQLEKQRDQLEKRKLNLEARLEGIKSSEEVSKEAIIKLGMNYPTEGQVIYVNVPETIHKRDAKSSKLTDDILAKIRDLVGR